jgi:MerR family transcriptional regulator, light-induced transcriptional regulator
VTASTDGLTIGELAERTGVLPATLRSWEIRFGFPRPQRATAGHRRYAQRDVGLVEEVLRQRAAGLSLPAAIAQAMAGHPAEDQSVFAVLRRRHPALQPQILRKATLLALTWAVEDEYCARSERAFLFGSFQQQRFFRRSEDRWNELARTAESVVVFADFDPDHDPDPGPDHDPDPGPDHDAGAAPTQIPVPAGAPLRREWVVVCEARDYPVCLAGWEFPGQRQVSDADRRFEVLWTLDPRPVRDAAVTCARLAESFSPGLNVLDRLPAEPAPPISADLQRATGLLTRMAAYLDNRRP